MSSILIVAVYAAVAALAIALLYYFGPRAWYWHVVSIALACALGFIPLAIPTGWDKPLTDLAVGSVFLFLMLWGIAAPAFRHHHHPHQMHPGKP